MHVKELKLVDFKAFSELTIRLPDRPSLVMLCGPNGSGKSSLLDAFSRWRQRNRWGLPDPEFFRRGGDRGGGGEGQYDLEFHEGPPDDPLASIYVRTAQRITVEFTNNHLQRLEAAKEQQGPIRSIDLDDRVAENFQRLVTESVDALWDRERRDRPAGDIVDSFVGAIDGPLGRLLPGLRFDGPDKPMEQGSTFRFSKNGHDRYGYKQLSGGEKAVFDLLLDAVLKRQEFPDAIWCIDEPELHVNPNIQGDLLGEVCALLPDTAQLWLCTHSAGMLAKAREIYSDNHEAVAFLDLGAVSPGQAEVVEPSTPDRPFWTRQLRVALGDFAALLAPSRVVLCEGYPSTTTNSNAQWDSAVLERIFADRYPDVGYFSVGNSHDVVGDKMHLGEALIALTDGVEVLRVVDRDARSEEEIQELEEDGCRVLRRRHLESYLLDYEVLDSLCEKVGQPEKSPELRAALDAALKASIDRGNPTDDFKKASSEFVTAARGLLGLVAGGNTPPAFLRDTVAPCLRPGMTAYEELRADVFGN
jgi:AAA domain